MTKPEYYQDNSGTYVRNDLFYKFRNLRKDTDTDDLIRYTHKNEKKAYQTRLGNTWVNIKMIKKQGKMVPNPSYLPDTIEHFTDLGNGYVKIPPGLVSFYIESFKRVHSNVYIRHPKLNRYSYEYQDKAVNELLELPVGLLHASTGSGKSQMIMDITNRLCRKTLIVVSNISLLTQMVSDFEKVMGITPLIVSGKKLSKKKEDASYKDIVICSIDSRDKIDPKEFGLILLDEADCYLGADERRSWIGSLSPEFMYALTGTVKVNHMHSDIFPIYYGKTTTLYLLHHTPDYIQTYSNFTMQMESDTKFHEIKEALYTDESRNNFIISTVLAYSTGRKGLVFTEQISHANILAEALRAKGKKVYILIGEVSEGDREKIREEIKTSTEDCIVVGSVRIIGRGFDIPELSYAILTTSEKFQSSIQQYIGRIVRSHPTKKHPIFIDIVDKNCYPLYTQAKSRASTFRSAFPDGKIYNPNNIHLWQSK